MQRGTTIHVLRKRIFLEKLCSRKVYDQKTRLFTVLSFPDINTPDSFGKTPLHNAILGKHVGIVNLLLKSGADVKCLDERGDTPLHAAVRVNSEAIVLVRI